MLVNKSLTWMRTFKWNRCGIYNLLDCIERFIIVDYSFVVDRKKTEYQIYIIEAKLIKN